MIIPQETNAKTPKTSSNVKLSPWGKRLWIVFAPILLLVGVMLSMRVAETLQPTPISQKRVPALNYSPQTIATKPLDEQTKTAIAKKVEGQLKAIGKRDFKEALRYASPEFRSLWTVERFQDMIEKAYPELIEAQQITLVEGRFVDNYAQMEVEVTTKENYRMGYIYDMAEDDGQWVVAGCSPGIRLTAE
jgi:hypothetical protein